MLAVDLVVGLLIVVAALVGARRGLLRALPVAGVAAGILLGSRVPLLVGEELDSNYALNIAIPAALVLGGIGAALGETVARRASRGMRRSLVVDTALGAILAGAAAAVGVWALAPAVSVIRSVRVDVRRSQVLDGFNAVLAPVRPPRDKAAPAPDLPRLARPRRGPAVGDTRLRARAEVKRAERNLVKILTDRCGGGYQGTGWIAGHGIVVTNAHIVSAADRVTVTQQGDSSSLDANVIWFDGIHDLALLRVDELRDERGLPLAADARPSTPAVTLGFPRGKLTIRRARLGVTTTRLEFPPIDLDSRAGISLTVKDRLVTVLRGLSGPGGSGGPVVDRRGNVVGTVFAGIPQNGITLAVPNRIVRSALRRANHRVEVPGCNAPPLKPTRAQSIAARSA
jgi:S1-C subfamily serine protease